MRLFFLVLGLLYFTAAHSSETQVPPLPFSVCSHILPYGKPQQAQKYQIPICRHAYALEYSGRYKTPTWVAYILRPKYTVGCLDRVSSFTVDRSILKQYRSSPSDYEGTGYDMGHMVSSADMSWDELVMRETFIMTNITPQIPGFNRGIWKRLEDQTRAWARERKHELLVYAGTIYTGDDNTIGSNRVSVPSGFFKVIVDITTKEVLAFRFPHTPIRASLDLFLVDVERLQADTGIYLPLPSDYVQSTELWPARLKSTRIAKSIVCTAAR